MAIVNVTAAEVVVRLTALEKVGALHGDVRVPRAAVRGVRISTKPFPEVRGLRAPGTGFPGLIALGTWRRRGGRKDFIGAYRGRPAVIIDLDQDHAGYERLIVSVDSPHEVQRLLASG
jgi:hypothetical protein